MRSVSLKLIWISTSGSVRDVSSYLEICRLPCYVEQNNWAILAEGIMKNMLVKYYEFGPVVQVDMSYVPSSSTE